jgi:hypothetical protein
VNNEITKSECLRYLENIFNAKNDVVCPTRPGAMVVIILASQDGFKLKTKHAIKEYDSVGDLFDALLQAERLHCESDDEALSSLHLNLSHIAP